MEYQKSFGNFTVGGGSMKVAGSGKVEDAVDAPKVKTKYDKKIIAKNAAKAAVLTAGVLFKHKYLGGGKTKKKKK